MNFERKNMIVIGANSSIAKDCIGDRAPFLKRVALCGRNSQSLSALAQDLSARFPHLTVGQWACELQDMNEAKKVWREVEIFCGGVDEMLFAPGELGDQSAMEHEPELAMRLISINSAASTAWLLWSANVLERQGKGVLAIVTSVAGVRGRASNYIYGSSKAQLSILAEGLRVRLSRVGVRVVDFRPGMVATPMTAKLRRSPLMASSQKVGGELANAIARKDGVVYSPSFWAAIMFVIRRMPYFIFKKTRF